MKVIATERLPIKMWLEDIQESALEQAKNLANLPFAFKHIAIMPDAHLGYGCPIGGVMAARNVVSVNCIGVDIGCGMSAIKTNLKGIDKETIKNIMGVIRRLVPVGFNRHSEPLAEELMPPMLVKKTHCFCEVNVQYEKARHQLGTLGGGNHFIEIQKDKAGFLWVMIHSGSRNLGKQVADHYNKIAVHLNAEWFSSVPVSHELAFLSLDTDEGISYMQEMNYCVDFALANRKQMMEKVRGAFLEFLPDSEFTNFINIAHNYAAMENHFGHNVMVHRKGATRAYEDEIGIIPGSQGTASYIVKGLGNPESFKSCSHGAGRCLGRKQAIKQLNLKDEVAKLDYQGIIHGIRYQEDLDEAAGAYKDIHTVMSNQEDLVAIVEELTPIAVIKG